MGGEQREEGFCAQEIDFVAIDARKFYVLQLCSSGPTASRAIGARNAMLCLWHSRGHIGTPR